MNECAAIQSAGNQIGHIFVAAAGGGVYELDLDVNPKYPASSAKSQVGCSVCPITNIITVTATDQDDNRACLRWDVQSYPPTCLEMSNYGDQTVHLGAPGTTVYSTVYSGSAPSYGYKSETSMAAPHVTGAVALVWAQHPTWTYTQVRDLILGSLHKKNQLAAFTITGGRLDIAAALLDCNDNGVADGIDVNTFTSGDCNDNNVPDECEGWLGPCCLPYDCIACLPQRDCIALGGFWHPIGNCLECALLAPQPGP